MVAYSFYETDARVRKYCEALSERGDLVEVLCLRKNGQEKNGIINGVHIHRMQRRTLNETRLLDYFFKVGFFFVRSFIFLSASGIRKKFDLIHIHNPPEALVFAALIPKLTGSRIILDFHDLLPEFYLEKFRNKFRKFFFKIFVGLEKASICMADLVIVANDIWKDRLRARSAGKTRILTVLNYPDIEPVRILSMKHEDGRFLIMYPGSLQHHQGVDLAIRAFKKVEDRIKGAKFHIYGSGNLKERLVSLIQELSLQDRVQILQPIPNPLVYEKMREADLAVVPKRDDGFGNEAFSTKILEFMALGVPVLVSDTRIDKLYFDERTVCFFKAGDVDDLAAKILDFYEDRERAASLRQAAADFVKEKTWGKMKSGYLEIVDSLK